MKFMGFVRPDGRVGVRNHIAVIPASVCAATVAARIAEQTEGAVALPNQHGCAQIGPDLDVTFRTLAGLGANPNVGAVLVIGLGCESVQADSLAREIAKSGKRTESIIIQKCGGTLKAQEQGLRIARELSQEVSKMRRTEADFSKLVLALECGGSDTTSGLAANPVHGYVSDRLVEMGGASILSETTELIGAEHVLARRAVTKETGDRLIEMVRACEAKANAMGVDMRGSQPTPGNIQGGLTTIEEKSLGCIYKGGASPLQGVLEYGEAPAGKGLYFMDTPGQDIESITGMVAGGAQVVIFTTGRGTPTGFPLAPVIKITGNPITFRLMEENIDINAGTIIEGTESIPQVGERVLAEIGEVCSGKLTKAEALKHMEFGIYKLTSTF